VVTSASHLHPWPLLVGYRRRPLHAAAPARCSSPCQSSPTTVVNSHAAAVERRRGIPTQESFSLRVDALPAGLLPYLAFLAARPTSAEEVEELAGWLFDQGDLPLLDGISTEGLAWQELATRCRQLLKGGRGKGGAATTCTACWHHWGGSTAQCVSACIYDVSNTLHSTGWLAVQPGVPPMTDVAGRGREGSRHVRSLVKASWRASLPAGMTPAH
jgi:hypothetical protein